MYIHILYIHINHYMYFFKYNIYIFVIFHIILHVVAGTVLILFFTEPKCEFHLHPRLGKTGGCATPLSRTYSHHTIRFWVSDPWYFTVPP